VTKSLTLWHQRAVKSSKIHQRSISPPRANACKWHYDGVKISFFTFHSPLSLTQFGRRVYLVVFPQCIGKQYGPFAYICRAWCHLTLSRCIYWFNRRAAAACLLVIFVALTFSNLFEFQRARGACLMLLSLCAQRLNARLAELLVFVLPLCKIITLLPGNDKLQE